MTAVTIYNAPAQPPDIGIFVLSYNGLKILEECLPTMFGQGHIVVVDNGSTDGTLEAIRETWRDVTIARLAVNVGLGSALNAAVRAVACRNVVLMNNDVKVVGDALKYLCNLLDERPDIGLAAPVLLNPDGSWQEYGNALGLSGAAAPPRSMERPAGETLFQSGCVTAVRRDEFLRFGGYAEFYGWYYEDVDLAWRYRRHHLIVFVDSRAQCIHLLGATLGNTNREAQSRARDDTRRAERLYLDNRNVLLLFVQNAPLVQLAVQLPIILLRQTIEALFALIDGRPKLANAFVRAWADAIRMIPIAIAPWGQPARRVSTLRFVRIEVAKSIRRFATMISQRLIRDTF